MITPTSSLSRYRTDLAIPMPINPTPSSPLPCINGTFNCNIKTLDVKSLVQVQLY